MEIVNKIEVKKNQYSNISTEERFWSKVNKKGNDECWEWKDYITENGYGQFRLGNTKIPAHKMSYIIHNGEVPFNMLICHRCDNGKCVNPKHLFIGTPQDNMIDMVNKGRSCYGEKCANSKLTQEIVKQIREEYSKENTTIYKLAEKYNVSARNISLIIRNETWTDKNYNPILRENMEGENNPFSKLTQEQANKIRELYKSGKYRQTDLAKLFEVSRFTIMRILNNKKYIKKEE